MSVKTWWFALIGVSAVNICAWILAGVLPVRRAPGDPAIATRRRQLLLSAPFVFGCAFRSIFPRADVQRIVVVDSWLSAVAVGRTVATIAELCFAAQCALLLRVLAVETRKPVALAISRVMVPLIAMAETFSWYSVITTNYIGNTLEESTWAMVATLLIVGLIIVRPRLQGSMRAFAGQAIWIIAGYFVFLATIDVPMYFGRWRSDQAAGARYLPFADGVRDAATRWVVTMRIEDWRWEMLWMSLYFSFGVWISVSLIRAPYPTTESGTLKGFTP
ncbi:MAG TPA: hypothetical protein VN903_38815 [Polyangia bacterium]|jgi:hypothetical protein|nr:hypothetical protein [Polyangia bacterium]